MISWEYVIAWLSVRVEGTVSMARVNADLGQRNLIFQWEVPADKFETRAGHA
jgi:hypothetical protein